MCIRDRYKVSANFGSRQFQISFTVPREYAFPLMTREGGYNVGVSHDVLQCLGVHARVCHSGTECMPHGVRRHHIGQRLLVALVVLLGKALEHGVIVDGGFGQAVRLGADRMYPSAL